MLIIINDHVAQVMDGYAVSDPKACGSMLAVDIFFCVHFVKLSISPVELRLSLYFTWTPLGFCAQLGVCADYMGDSKVLNII